MLRKAKTLTGYTLKSHDGEIGKVTDFYFDDRHWTISFLIADAGNWLTNRQVLISPSTLVELSEDTKQIKVNLTQKQIEDSPSMDSDNPASHQYGPVCWEGTPCAKDEKAQKQHLHSAHIMSGFHVLAADGEVGHVEDFIIDDETWEIRNIVIETGNRQPGKKILVSTEWIERINWEDLEAFVNLTRDTIS
jgi:uncharacterized protein YrrD